MASSSRYINKGSDQLFDHNCDVCLTQGITSEGISYCIVCNEYLCQTCERSHKGSKASKDHRLLTESADPSGSIQRKQVPPIMFCDIHKTSIIEFICTDHDEAICDTCKIANHTKCRTAHLSRHVKQTDVHGTLKVFTKELDDLSARFNNLQNTRQTDKKSMKGQIKTCLRPAPTSVPNKAWLVTQVSNRSAPKSLLNIEVTGRRKQIDLKSDDAHGCVFMGDGHLVVACSKYGLELYDKDGRYKSELDIKSCDMAVIDDYTVILTRGDYNQLQYVQVLPDMKVGRTVRMDKECWGVDVCGDKLYVTCTIAYVHAAEVQVLTMDCKVLRRLGVDNGKYMFTRPYYVKVSKAGDKVFVSDYYTDTITCLSTQGRTLYKYTDTDLKGPRGMYVDETDNLVVCGGDSNNIHVVRHDGTRDRILLSRKDGIEHPQAISYRPGDGCLAVVQGSPSLLTFSTKI